jgi:hypothetical protein
MTLGDATFPGILILFKMLLRTCMGQSVNCTNFVKAMQALPLDISFFSLSLFVAYDRVFAPDPKLFTTLVLALIMLSAVVTLLVRWAESLLIDERLWWSHFITVLNLALSVLGLQNVLSILVA